MNVFKSNIRLLLIIMHLRCVRMYDTSKRLKTCIYIIKSRFLFNHETAGNRSRTREPA